MGFELSTSGCSGRAISSSMQAVYKKYGFTDRNGDGKIGEKKFFGLFDANEGYDSRMEIDNDRELTRSEILGYLHYEEDSTASVQLLRSLNPLTQTDKDGIKAAFRAALDKSAKLTGMVRDAKLTLLSNRMLKYNCYSFAIEAAAAIGDSGDRASALTTIETSVKELPNTFFQNQELDKHSLLQQIQNARK